MDKHHANYQPREKAFDRILTPYEEFNHKLFVEHMQTLLNDLRNKPDTDKADAAAEQCIIRDGRSRALQQTLENGVHSVEPPAAASGTLHAPPAGLSHHSAVRPGQCRRTHRFRQRRTGTDRSRSPGCDGGPGVGQTLGIT